MQPRRCLPGRAAVLAARSRLPCPPASLPPLRACSELDKLCEFFHIPFQSGDNDILRDMKRGEGRTQAVSPSCGGQGRLVQADCLF